MQVRLTIQEKLKDLRVERHLTPVELVKQTGISNSALGKYEVDDYKDINPFSIVTLSKFYGISTDYLLGLTEQSRPPAKPVVVIMQEFSSSSLSVSIN